MINGALAKSCAASRNGGIYHWANPRLSGVNPETGDRWLMYDFIIGEFSERGDLSTRSNSSSFA
jgi:hypothetical protein